MKKVMIFTLAAILLCSCAKEAGQMPTPTVEDEGVAVSFKFGNAGNFSRAFFDNTNTAEPWEKKVNSILVVVFDRTGKTIMRRSLIPSEVATLRGTVYLDKEYVGQTVSVYAIANYTPSYTVSSTEENFQLHRLSVSGFKTFNGNFEDVTTGCLNENGFAMTGKAECVVMPEAETQVTIQLKRVLVKVAMEIDIDPAFLASLGQGEIRVLNGGITNISQFSYLIPNTTFAKSGTIDNVIQNGHDGPNSKQRFLVYIYEQGPFATAEEFPQLSLFCQYRASGVSEGNYIFLTYRVPLPGSGNGEFKRNGYYRIRGTIKDMDVLELTGIFTVADWETPATEEIEDIIIVSD